MPKRKAVPVLYYKLPGSTQTLLANLSGCGYVCMYICMYCMRVCNNVYAARLEEHTSVRNLCPRVRKRLNAIQQMQKYTY